MKILRNIFLGGLCIFMAVSFVYPNPFGNNPDIIADESYFLTSSLSAIEKATIPGWEFSPSGSYYGGVQTYIDYAVLVPVIAAVWVSSHFSLISAKLWVALHTGELLHIFRIVNGLLALGVLAACYRYFSARKIPRKLSVTLILFLSLLLSNVLFIEFLHTAKVWTTYVLIVAVAGAFFLANEYYAANGREPFITKEKYAALLIWSGALAFFQNYFGAISILLLAVYALILRHIRVHDLWRHIRKYWYLLVLLTLTQLSFMYRAVFVIWLGGGFSNVSVKTAAGHIDWALRLYNPLLFALQSHPLSVVFFLTGALGVLLASLREKSFWRDERRKRYLGIALVHPLLVYLIFYVGVGFDFSIRYAIFLTMALSFSATIVWSELGLRWAHIAAALSAALFLIIGIHSITLYWRPSSETDLLRVIETNYNSASNTFIQRPDAQRLSLPINPDSLSLLDERRQQMGRLQFLLQNENLLGNITFPFKPVSVVTYSQSEFDAALLDFRKGTTTVWTITTSCENACTDTEINAKECFEFNAERCSNGGWQEIDPLFHFLSSDQLGYSYILRKAR